MPSYFAVVKRSLSDVGRDSDETWVNVVTDVRQDGRPFATLVTLQPWVDSGHPDFIVELTEGEYNTLNGMGLHRRFGNLPKFQQQTAWTGGARVAASIGRFTDPADDQSAWVPDSPIPDPRWILHMRNGNPDGTAESVTIISAAGIATVTHAAHSLHSGDQVTIAGANEADYNGTFEITVLDINTYTYAVSGSPTTPATGSITATPVSDHVAVIDYDEDTGTRTVYMVLHNANAVRVGTNAADRKTLINGVGFIFDFGSSHDPPLGGGCSTFKVETDAPGVARFLSSGQYRVVGPGGEDYFEARVWGRSLQVQRR